MQRALASIDKADPIPLKFESALINKGLVFGVHAVIADKALAYTTMVPLALT